MCFLSVVFRQKLVAISTRGRPQWSRVRTFSRSPPFCTCTADYRCGCGGDERDSRTEGHGQQRSEAKDVRFGSYIRESFAALEDGAFVWLFTRMGANVNGQCTSLDEALVTDMLPRTLVRPLVGVNSEMALKIRFAIEAL